MKKFLFLLIGLLALLLIASQVFKAQIGERIFARAVSNTIGNNILADLPDGLHVVLIGTGSPQADPSRAGPSTAVIAGKRVFIIDSGDGAVRNMGAIGLSPGAVERVFLTHFHSDHIDGLGGLMLMRWAAGGHDKPLPIHGPEGVDNIVTGFNQAYAQDQTYRTAHHGADIMPPSGFGGVAQAFDGKAETTLNIDGITITAFPVAHDPVSPAVGYRFNYQGRSVTLTGDTAYDAALAVYAKDTDILLSEALNADMVGVIETAAGDAGNVRGAKIMNDIPSYHITPVQAADVARDAGADILVYTHIVPALPSPYLNKYFTKGAADKFSGEIMVGTDGLMLSLPAGSNRVSQRKLK